MHSFFMFLLITQDLNNIKKNPTHPFVGVGKQETCAKFQKKILNSRVVAGRQSSKFLYEILNYLISTIKLQRKQSVKTNFKLTTQTTLSRSEIMKNLFVNISYFHQF